MNYDQTNTLAKSAPNSIAESLRYSLAAIQRVELLIDGVLGELDGPRPAETGAPGPTCGSGLVGDASRLAQRIDAVCRDLIRIRDRIAPGQDQPKGHMAASALASGQL